MAASRNKNYKAQESVDSLKGIELQLNEIVNISQTNK